MGTTYSSNTISFSTPVTTPTILYTKPAVTIKGTSAISGGDSIISNGGSSIIAKGICWSTSNNPSILDSVSVNGGTTNNYYECDLRNLSPNTTYYVRSYASNSLYTGYGPVKTFQTTNIQLLDDYQGGYVALIFQPGDVGYVANQVHGLIVARNDQVGGYGSQWYNGTNTITGATATVLGSGNSNTNTIVSSQGIGSYAAKTCSDLIINGYSDWYLPSIIELYRICINQYNYGGRLNSFPYWTSSEVNLTSALVGGMGGQSSGTVTPKSTLNAVRAIRTF
jgi:hypothetical protein